MSRSVFKVMEQGGGWRLIDNGRPVFWFPERDKAIEIAKQMADARSMQRGLPTDVQALGDDGEVELVAAYE